MQRALPVPPKAWPERVWHGAQAFTRFLAREPSIAYLGFVECYAIGPGFAMRAHETQLAFTLSLEEGYRQRPQAQSLPRACSALSAAAIFELGFWVSRHSPSIYLWPIQPLAVYIALARFIGADEAGEFLMAKLSATGPAPRASAPDRRPLPRRLHPSTRGRGSIPHHGLTHRPALT